MLIHIVLKWHAITLKWVDSSALFKSAIQLFTTQMRHDNSSGKPKQKKTKKKFLATSCVLLCLLSVFPVLRVPPVCPCL